MQPPTDNLYKFLAIFGLLVCAFSIYVPMLRYLEFNRLSNRSDAIYGPMIGPSKLLADEALLELECAIHRERVRDKPASSKPDPCPQLAEAKLKSVPARAEIERLKAQVAPLEVERASLWQEYVLFLYVAIGGFVVGVAMCVAGFWLWYVRLQRYLDAAVKADANSRKATRTPISRSTRGA